MKELVAQLLNDKELREAWKANIAMAYKDNYAQYANKQNKVVMNRYDRHVIANNAAEYFLKTLCDEIQYPEGR